GVEFPGVEHRTDIGMPGHAESLARSPGLCRVDVTDGGKHRALRCEVAPCVQMVLCVKAAADEADAYGSAGHESSRQFVSRTDPPCRPRYWIAERTAAVTHEQRARNESGGPLARSATTPRPAPALGSNRSELVGDADAHR